MSTFKRLARHLDRVGGRPLVAVVASAAYKDHSFSVDAQGRWINCQGNLAIVSPDINTMSMEAVKATVEANWCHVFKPAIGDVVLDIGAGIGDEALAFAEMVGVSGRVIAVEASPVTFACLSETVRRSALTNVICVNAAITDQEGYVNIEDSSEHVANSILSGIGKSVRSMDIDTLIDEHHLAHIDLLKMNIEGAEKLAVAGLKKHTSLVRNWAISCHDFMADRSEEYRSKAEVTAALEAYGFAVDGRSPVDGEPWVSDYIYARPRFDQVDTHPGR